MANAAVAQCYATLVEVFGSMKNRLSPHRGSDYKAKAGQKIVAYEECTVVSSDSKTNILGHYLVAKRKRDNKYIGWAHVRVGTRPALGTVLMPGDSVGLVAGADDFHGSAWSGPHIHTTEGLTIDHIRYGIVTDPAPDIAEAVRKAKVVVKPVVTRPTASKPPVKVAPKFTIGPILDSGKDWAYRRPTGALAKLVVKELKLKKRLPADYKNDGNPGELFDIAVQKTLNFSKIFVGKEDGRLLRGGCYGIQMYGAVYGGYKSKHDGRPEVISWSAFAKGLHG
jgi:hypothetical protein